MNRTELVRAVSRRVDQPQWLVDIILDGFVEVTADEMARTSIDPIVNMRGFGKFVVRYRNAVTRVNPKTGDEILVPPRRTVAFLPSPNLRTKVNS